MLIQNHRRNLGKSRRKGVTLFTALTLALVLSSCGSSADSGGTTTIPIETLKEELAAGLEDVYLKLENADYKSSKSGDGVLDADDVSAALLKENLYSKVDVVMDDYGLAIYSRNLCAGQGYDSILKSLKPAKKVFSTAFRPQNVRSNKSEEYVVMSVQLSVFPEVVDSALMSLYQNFNDTVTAVGSTCESKFRNGLTNECKWSDIQSSIPNWWIEEDLKGLGCKLGAGETDVTSKVTPVEIDFFNSPFVLNQISSKDRGRIIARSVVVMPQRTLKTVFVMEVTAARNGSVTSASQVPSLRDVALNSTNVAAELTLRWAEIVRKEFDLTSLIAKDLAIFEYEN